MKLERFKTFEAAYSINDDGSLKKLSDDDWTKIQASGKAEKISLKDFFKSPIKSPYPGLVIKTNDGVYGVIIDVFERNGDFLFDMYKNGGEIDKNLSWNREYKIAYGDKIHGYSAFGENGLPNRRHKEEILPLIEEAEEKLGLNLGVAKQENLN